MPGAGYQGRDEPKLHLLTGVSVVLGRESNWNFNIGAALGRQTLLGSGLSVGSELASNEASVPTYNAWRAGLQLGISYQLFEVDN